MKCYRLLLTVLAVGFIFGCSSGKNTAGGNQKKTITLAAYTVPKEVYQNEIIPRFKRMWTQKTGLEVTFEESYVGSGAQSRAILAGFEADVAALSLEKDVERLRQAGLINHDWKRRKFNGWVTTSTVVLVVRPGNPLGISNWEDLLKKDLSILYPSPKTSGGAMWILNAIYGTGLISKQNRPVQEQMAAAKSLLKQIQARVRIMDKSGRASVTTFENGIGDVLFTYENEALLRQKKGLSFPIVRLDPTILIENPVAMIDKNVAKHNNREVVEAFIEFLTSDESQRSFAEYGFRPVSPAIQAEYREKYPMPSRLFDVSFLGGWNYVYEHVYGEKGVWDQVIYELANEK